MNDPRTDAPVDRQIDPTDPRASVEEPLVDWSGTGRRLALSMVIVQVVALTVFLMRALFVEGAFSLSAWVSIAGLGLVLSFAAEFVIVGGAAASGMLRAGARGERLSSPDVGLKPPPIRRPEDPRT